MQPVDLDLPTPAETRRLLDTWRSFGGGPVGVAFRDLQGARAVLGNPCHAPLVGGGAWLMAELPTVTDDPRPLPGDPVRLAVWAYSAGSARLEHMVPFIEQTGPLSVEVCSTMPADTRARMLAGYTAGWVAMFWPRCSRAMLLLHRLAVASLPSVRFGLPADA